MMAYIDCLQQYICDTKDGGYINAYNQLIQLTAFLKHLRLHTAYLSEQAKVLVVCTDRVCFCNVLSIF
jgi:hypothetical protein